MYLIVSLYGTCVHVIEDVVEVNNLLNTIINFIRFWSQTCLEISGHPSKLWFFLECQPSNKMQQRDCYIDSHKFHYSKFPHEFGNTLLQILLVLLQWWSFPVEESWPLPSPLPPAAAAAPATAPTQVRTPAAAGVAAERVAAAMVAAARVAVLTGAAPGVRQRPRRGVAGPWTWNSEVTLRISPEIRPFNQIIIELNHWS